MRTVRTVSACLAALALTASTAAAFDSHDESASLEIPLLGDTQRAALASRPAMDLSSLRAADLGMGWKAQLDPRTGFARMAYGGSIVAASIIRDEAQAESIARQFVSLHQDLLGVQADNARLGDVRQALGKYAVHFQQVIDGIPVYKGDAFVLMSASGRIGAFGSNFEPRPEGGLQRATVSMAGAIAMAASSIGATPSLDRPQTGDLYLMPAPSGELLELTPVWRTVFESSEPFGKWETFVHGVTGEILGRRNLYFPVNVSGSSTGDVAANPVSYGYCDGYSTFPFKNQTVTIQGGASAQTDASGNVTIPNAGSTPVNVTAQFLGPFSNVNRFSGLGADASQTISVTPGTPFAMSWVLANSRNDERTTFYMANRVHDFIKAVDPTLTQADYAMPSVIGRTDGFCPGNAWWDGNAMNYCSAASIYFNTGEMGNVISHEFGHGVTQWTYGRHGQPEPPGGLHEGNSDVLANFTDRQPIIGLGFSTSTGCGSGIRNSVNSLTYPSSNENGGHTAGQVIAGFHWLSWQALLGVLPQAQADAVAFSTWHAARDLGTPQTFPAQVLWTFMADDDDANLGNGTPHYDQLCPAAIQKGFQCPELLVGVFIAHSPLAHTTNGSLGFDVTATITSTIAAMDPSQLKTFYRVNGGSLNEILMTSTGNPDEYSAHVPALSQSSEVEYYISATDLAANTRTSPTNAPTSMHAFDVAWAYDNLEAGSVGWQAGVPGDNAVTGLWGRFDPVGTSAQPADDATPAPGIFCFITGQCGAGGGSCGSGCSDYGCNDVDAGTTTLLSPVYNLAGATSAKIKFARWYSNDQGGAPGEDSWVVDVSNNGGTTWTNIENTIVSSAWITVSRDLGALFGTLDQVRLRFRASDLINPSLVEGAVDELRILATFAGTDAPVMAEAAAPAVLALDPSQPNPFRSQTRIDYSVPRQSDVQLSVYDIGGREVRKLVSGMRDIGRYRADWDGRDSGGAHVAAGVYFFRLTAEGQAVTRKVTVMQ